ncbi:MAG: hypothetical protein R2708_07740 [Vicinamibacterales bacterium]
MTIQVNSDKTVAMDASLVRFVKDEVDRILETASAKLTRVEVHLSDVNSRRTGPPDKRCLVEARPAGARPITTTATAKRFDAAIGSALKKMRRALSSMFARKGRTATAPGEGREGRVARKAAPAPKAAVEAVVKPAKKAAAKKPSARKPAAKKPAAKKPAATAAAAKGTTAGASGREPRKKAIFQARRKAWPVR